MMRRASLQEKEEGRPFLPPPCEDTARLAASNQGESPRQNPAGPVPWSQTSSPQSPGGDLCCLSRPAVVFLLQQQALPKTTLFTKTGQVWPAGHGFLTPDLGGLDISLPSS